jgi:peptidoglycan/LPS O-acetylase OafA/YrhL
VNSDSNIVVTMRFSASYLFVLLLALVLLLATPSVDAQRRPVARRTTAQGTEQSAAQSRNSKRRVKRRGLAGKDGSSTTSEAFDSYTAEHSSTSSEPVIASSSGVEGGSTKGRNPTPWYIAAGILLALAAAGTAYWAVAKRRRQKEQEAKELEMANSKKSKFLGGGKKNVPPPVEKSWWKFG